jgi:uncharacterized membrane protein (UPF0127 family)
MKRLMDWFRMTGSGAAALFVFTTFAAQVSYGGTPPDNPNRIHQLRTLKVTTVKAAKQTIYAWIMDNESKREEGMMFLHPGDVKENQGMIFVFPAVQPAKNAFWMHNCPAGLDIIYITKGHQVVNVGDGPPESDATVVAKGPYQFVLEVNRGWAKRHGLKKGDMVSFSSSLSTKE